MTRYVRYLMALRCIFFMRVLILAFGMSRLMSFSMECSCMAPHACCDGYEGVVFHPLFWMDVISGSYLVCFCVMACSGNMSWQYVNSMNWTLVMGDGVTSVCVWFGAPIIGNKLHSTSGWFKLGFGFTPFLSLPPSTHHAARWAYLGLIT